ncbi:hypothetical protein GCM10009793_13610 [Brachybacterium phenoliresistens]
MVSSVTLAMPQVQARAAQTITDAPAATGWGRRGGEGSGGGIGSPAAREVSYEVMPQRYAAAGAAGRRPAAAAGGG